jgi:hypothetical protein
MTIQAACSLSLIDRRTYYRWLDESEEWKAEVQEAIDFAEAVNVARIKTLGDERGDWRAYAWLLERRHPDRWGPKREIEITQNQANAGQSMVLTMLAQTDERLKAQLKEESLSEDTNKD